MYKLQLLQALEIYKTDCFHIERAEHHKYWNREYLTKKLVEHSCHQSRRTFSLLNEQKENIFLPLNDKMCTEVFEV